MNDSAHESQASEGLLMTGAENSQESSLVNEGMTEKFCGAQQDIPSPQNEVQISFGNLTPLRKKTLDLLRENPDLDGATADRLAREALRGSAAPSQVASKARIEGSVRNRSGFVPAPGNFGTSHLRNDLNKDFIMDRLQGLPLADRQEAFLAALTAAAEKSRRK